IAVSGAACTAALMTSGPAEACTVTMSGRSRATARAAPATVAGMSCSFRSSPIFTVLTCGVTRPAQRAAVSRSGASSATAMGAGWLNSPPRVGATAGRRTHYRTLHSCSRQPATRRAARLVSPADHIGEPLDPALRELVVELPEDPHARGRIMENGRAHADHGRPGQDQLQR